ncbi:MAG: hypothetical protein WCP85_18475 [Mariniphaga sp.]
MMSLYDIANCTLQYENSKPQKVWEDFMKLIDRTEDPDLVNQYCNNLKFLLRLIKYILSNTDEVIRFAVISYLAKLVDRNYDFTYSYNWQELRAILFYCNYMRDLTGYKEFAEKLQNPHFNNCICSYIIEDSTLPERKIKAKSLIIPLEPANSKSMYSDI